MDLEACEKLLVITGTTHPGSFLRSGHTAYGPSASTDALVARLAAISRPLCSPLIGLEHARACAQGPGAALHVRRAAVFTRRAARFSTTMLMLPSLAHLTKLSTSSELATAALDAQHERQKRPCAAARGRVFAV